MHTKICVVERSEGKKLKRYGFISTGNFNESTARIYTDYTLFTSHQKILKDVLKVFNFLEVNYKIKKYKHLIVSPHYTFAALIRLIDNEIENKKTGKVARIRLKLNNITNYKIIENSMMPVGLGWGWHDRARDLLFGARVKGMSGFIRVISVVDKFLEHLGSIFLKMPVIPKCISLLPIGWPAISTTALKWLAPFTTKIYNKNCSIPSWLAGTTMWKRVWSTPKRKTALLPTQGEAVRSQWATYAYLKKN